MVKTTLACRMRLVCEADLGPVVEGAGVSECAAKMLLMALLRYTDAAGVAWPSRPTLSRDSGLSVSQVARTLRAMEEHGLILDGHSERARGRSRRRRVDFDALRLRTTTTPERTTPPAPAHAAPPTGAPCAPNTPPNDSSETDQEHAEPSVVPRVSREGAEASTPAVAAVVPSLVEMGIAKEQAQRIVAAHPRTPVGTLGMLALGVDARVVRALLDEHGDEALADAVRGACAKKGLRSPAGYAVRAVREGWAPPPEAAARQRVAQQEAAQQRAYDEHHERERRERVRFERQQRDNERALDRIRAMPDDERHEHWRSYLDAKRATYGDLVAAVMAKRDPLASPLAARDFEAWLDAEASSSPTSSAKYA